MDFQIEKSSLHKAVSKVEGIISAREIRSILSNILIDVEQDKVSLHASDLEIASTVTTNCSVKKTGKITVPAKKFSHVLREFQSETINIQLVSDEKIVIKSASQDSKAQTTIMGSSAEEYPSIHFPSDDQYVSIPSSTMSEMLRLTVYSIAEDDARYTFNGLYMKSENGILNFVATDGRRLSLVQRKFSQDPPFSKGLILPHKAVKELQKLSELEDLSVAYDDTEKRLFFKSDNMNLISKLIDGNYPDYMQVIPEKVEYEVTFSKGRLESVLRHVSVMAAEPSRRVLFQFQSGSVEVTSQTPDIGESHDTILAEYKGEDIPIAFNSNYFLDVIRNLSCDDIILGFSSSNSPVVVKNPQDKDFTAVIMPMKI